MPKGIQTEEELFYDLLADLEWKLQEIKREKDDNVRVLRGKIEECRERIAGSWAYYLGLDLMRSEIARIEALEERIRKIDEAYPRDIKLARIEGLGFIAQIWASLGDQERTNYIRELRAVINCSLAPTKCSQCLNEIPARGCNHRPSIVLFFNGVIKFRIPGNIDSQSSINQFFAERYETEREMILKDNDMWLEKLACSNQRGLRWFKQLQLENTILLSCAEERFCADWLWEKIQSKSYHQAVQVLARRERKKLINGQPGGNVKSSSEERGNAQGQSSGKLQKSSIKEVTSSSKERENVKSSSNRNHRSRKERSQMPLKEDEKRMIKTERPEFREKNLMNDGRDKMEHPVKLEGKAGTGWSAVASIEDDWDEWFERAHGVVRFKKDWPVGESQRGGKIQEESVCQVNSISRNGADENEVEDSVPSSYDEIPYYLQ